MKTILQMLLTFGMVSLLAISGCTAKTQNTHPSQPPYSAVNSAISEGDHSKAAIVPHPEIAVDKTYHNQRFKFEVNYPSIWSAVEDKDRAASPTHGIKIFIGSSPQSSIDSSTIDRNDHIAIIGCVSQIGIPEAGMTTGEFLTNDGLKAVTYSRTDDGMLNTYYVFNETGRTFGYVVRVCVSADTNEKYNDVILKMLRSFRLIPK